MQKNPTKFIKKMLVFLLIPTAFLFLFSSQAKAVVGLTVGNGSLNLGATENLIYGNIGTASSPTSNYILFQKNGSSLFNLDSSGNLLTTGSITANTLSLTSTTLSTNLNADLLDGQHYSDISDTIDSKIATAKSTNFGYRYSYTLWIYGDTDKYYPFVIYGGDQNVKRDILIKRSYSETHPAEWNTATHGGGLTLKIKTNFGGWGGANYSWEIHELEEMYNSTFGGADTVASYMGFAIFLRGGGTGGAIYHVYSDQPIEGTHPVHIQSEGGTSGTYPIVYYNSEVVQYGSTSYTWTMPAALSTPSTESIRIRKFIALTQAMNANITALTNNYVPKRSGSFYFANSLLFDNGSNVGIATTNPGTRLSVVGDGTYSIDAGNNRIGNLAAPVNATDAVNRTYLDSAIATATSSISTLWGGTTGGNVWNLNSGNVGVGTTNPGEKLTVGSGNIKLYSTQNVADQYRYIGTEYNNGNGNNKAEIRFAIDGTDTKTRLTFHTANGAGTINEQMRITSGGNVGIGTTNPQYSLHVENNVFTQALIKGAETTRAVELLLLNSDNKGLNINVTGPSYASGAVNDIRLSPSGTGMSSVSIGAARGSGVPVLTANVSTGNMGIGTTNPGAPLDIKNTTSGLGLRLTSSGSTYWDITSIFSQTNPDLIFKMGGSEKFRFDNTGALEIGYSGAIPSGTKLLVNGNVGIATTNPGTRLSVVGDGTYSIDAGSNRIGNVSAPVSATDAVNRSYLDSAIANATSSISTLWGGSVGGNVWSLNSGNVGIGTTTPVTKLDVLGTIRANGLVQSLQLGGSNYMFTMDANNVGGPRLQLGVLSNPATYFEVGAWGGINNFDSKNRDLKLFTTSGLLYIANATGNVGIGTTSPAGILDLATTATANGYFLDGKAALTGEYSDNWLRLNNSNSWTNGVYTPSVLRVDGELRQGASDYGAYSLQTSGNLFVNTSAALAVSSGSVGIGIASPAQGKLWVQGGDIWMTGNSSRFAFNTDASTDSTPNATIMATQNGISGSSADLIFKTWSGSTDLEVLRMRSTGNVGIGTTAPGTRLSVVGDGTYSIDAGNNRIGNVSAPVNATDAVNRSYLDSAIANATSSISTLWGGSVGGNVWSLNSGNVGIGTSNPTFKLDVTGDINQSGILTNLPVANLGSDSLAVYYPFDGNVKDYSAMNNNGTVTNASFTSAGKIGGGYNFDGSGDSIQLANPINNSTWSIGMWFNINNAVSYDMLYSGTDNTDIQLFFHNTSKKITTSVENVERTVDWAVSDHYNEWHHVVWVHSGVSSKVYIDGILLLDTTDTTYTKNDASVRIGSTLAGAYSITGKLDEFFVYDNRSLSASEIKQIYNSTTLLQAGQSYVRRSGDTMYGNFTVNGNVGIGTTNPTHPLEVQTGQEGNWVPVAGFFAPDNTIAGRASQIRFGVSALTGNAGEWRYVHQGDNNIANRIDFGWTGYSAPVLTYTVAAKVGIGTTAPGTRLTVVGDGTYSIDAGNNRIGNVSAPVNATDAVNRSYLDSAIANATSSISSVWGGSVGGNVWSLNSGNVGIGTTNPLLPFQVNGKVAIGDSVSTARLNSLYGPRAVNLIDSNATLRVWRFDSNAANASQLELGIGTNDDFGDAANKVWMLGAWGGGYFTINDRTGGGNGVERLRINSYGNVGIGTTNPGTFVAGIASRLEVSGNILSSPASGDAAIGVIKSGGKFAYLTAGSSGAAFGFAGTGFFQIGRISSLNATSQTADLRIDSTGNVGIGTTNPTQLLDVNGQGFFKSSNAIPNPGDGSGSGTRIGYRTTGDYGYIQAINTGVGFKNLALQQDGGNVGIGTTNPVQKLQVAGNIQLNNNTGVFNFDTSGGVVNAFHFNNANNMIFGYRISGSGDFPVRFYTGSSERLRISADGNVGIATTTPGTRLTVVGDGTYSIDAGNNRIGNLSAPVNAADAVNRSYLDSAIANATSSISSVWGGSVGGNVWSLNSGNVGIGITNPSQKLDVSGKISIEDAGGSVFVGKEAGINDDASNNYNTGIGKYALNANTSGFYNAANGYGSLRSNTTGSYNTANGYGSLRSNTTGSYNTANGYGSLYNNTGSSNTANGYGSLFNNTTGIFNTANGYYSLYSNTTGNYNTANGFRSLNDNTGSSNTANGYGSLRSNTTGSFNTANGYESLYSNTTGLYNTANGYGSLRSNTEGYYNAANGYYSLYSNTTGNYNTANGYQAGRYIANGATGRTTGDHGLYLGDNTKASADDTNNEIVIGYNAIGKGSNTASYGNTSMLKHIFEAGNVGIGTTNPGTRLSVVGDGTYSIDAGNNRIGNIAAPVNDNDAVNKNYLDSVINIVSSGSSMWSGTLDGNIWNSTAGAGNVGIGTTNPSQKLDVSGKIALDGVTIAYRPTNLMGTLVLGDGGESLLGGTGDNAYYNTFVGIATAGANTTGRDNTAVGFKALRANSTGYQNSVYGVAALGGNDSGYNNIALGYYAGAYATNSSTTNLASTNSIFLGSDSKPLADSQDNQIVIGTSALGNGSNTVTIGNDSITKTILKGKLGIGVTNPTHPLEVSTTNSGSWTPVAGFYAPNNINPGYVSQMRFGASNSLGNSAEWRYIHQGNNNFYNRVDFAWNGYATPVMTYNVYGNVGIGTTNPTVKFQVDGSSVFNQPVTVSPPTAANHAVNRSYMESAISSAISSAVSGVTATIKILGGDSVRCALVITNGLITSTDCPQ